VQSKSDYLLSIKVYEGTLLYSLVADEKILLSGKVSSGNLQYTLEMLSNTELSGGRHHSITGGYVTDDGKYYIVAATESELTLLNPDNNFATVKEISDDYSKLLSVEAADLNKNGIDEIFVSHIFKNREMRSQILEYKDGAFTPVADNLKWVFRSVNTPLGRDVYAQQVSKDGLYSGEINKVFYSDGKYKFEPVQGTLGKRLFGFTTFSDKDENYFVSILKGSKLTVSTFKKSEYTSPGYFGDTFLTLNMEVPRNANPSPGMNSSEQFRRENIIHVNPRIEIFDEENFIIARNDLMSRLFANTLIFSESAIDIYSYKFSMLKKVAATVSGFEPVIVDLWSYKPSDKETILLVLKSNNPSAFSFGKSSIIKFRIEKQSE
jgi:hypothetical protein